MWTGPLCCPQRLHRTLSTEPLQSPELVRSSSTRLRRMAGDDTAIAIHHRYYTHYNRTVMVLGGYNTREGSSVHCAGLPTPTIRPVLLSVD